MENDRLGRRMPKSPASQSNLSWGMLAALPWEKGGARPLTPERSLGKKLPFAIRPIRCRLQPNLKKGTDFMNNKKLTLLAAAAAFSLLASQNAFAQKKYDSGASDTEIKIGNVEAYSGPASAYGMIGKTEEAFFKMINDQGGINGRKINFISYDDGYSPPKTVEQVRKLIESDEVFLIFNALGTPTQTAVQKYQNTKKVPQLFLATGASKWNDPKDFPWTMGFQPSYRVEARIFAKYILKEKPDAKIAVFYQNDDFGKDYVAGLKDIFGDKASKLIIAEESYETSEPSIDSHIVKLKGTGADVFVNIATPKFAAQAIKKMAELEWKPMHLMTDVSISIGAVMQPAGLEASEGVLSAGYLKDASDPQWKNDEGMKKFMAFAEKYMPGVNVSDANTVYGFAAAQTMVQVLKQCGDNLTRENVMKQAASMRDFAPDTLIPGIKVNTSATDFAPIEQLKMMQFKKGNWELFGDIISAETGG
jgi:branched-chain amino acid transport system substrate-binding protein